MKKVYCKDCKNFISGIFCTYCNKKPYYDCNWYEKKLTYVDPEKRNRHNDCKYFEKKEPEPEKPKVIPPEIKKKHWWSK